jgi:hypothetical protein
MNSNNQLLAIHSFQQIAAKKFNNQKTRCYTAIPGVGTSASAPQFEEWIKNWMKATGPPISQG